MKTMFVTLLLLLCLFARVHGDCQKDCLACSKHLYQYSTFDALVCILECEVKVSSSEVWEACKRTLVVTVGTDSLGVDTYSPPEIMTPRNDGHLFESTMKHFGDITKVTDMDRKESEKRVAKAGLIRDREEEEEEDSFSNGNESLLEMDNDRNTIYGPSEPSHEISKKFGGFLKGKYSYRKLLEPGRGIQKRYGGFIGVRKSARKWNNQKRFSEFLKQYLGMSTRSSEYDSVSADINEQNEI
ncbi:prepronociceptin [Protopterus annectens]|uniref:prepronociceptin n=1 Tax=Protopterus annectens TaxID=7888 RepID=UPI001CFB8A33|nr:prepronociceptin [Protopterus annectens]